MSHYAFYCARRRTTSTKLRIRVQPNTSTTRITQAQFLNANAISQRNQIHCITSPELHVPIATIKLLLHQLSIAMQVVKTVTGKVDIDTVEPGPYKCHLAVRRSVLQQLQLGYTFCKLCMSAMNLP